MKTRFLCAQLGLPSISLEVSKRTGENIIQTIGQVRRTEAFVKNLPAINVTFTQDNSKRILDVKGPSKQCDFGGSSGDDHCGAFFKMAFGLYCGGSHSHLILAGILIMGLLGHTLNPLFVLFSLILSVGMLVDGAIIVVEYADRKMLEGLSPTDAYRDAAIHMRWPVFTSTITVLLVFLPLLFWPGVIGQFMKYLPITLLATLTASLFVALIFVPTLGALFGRLPKNQQDKSQTILESDTGVLKNLRGSAGFYVRFLEKLKQTHAGFVGRSLVAYPCGDDLWPFWSRGGVLP